MSDSLDEKGHAMKEVVSSFQIGLKTVESKVRGTTKAESAVAKPYGKVAEGLAVMAKTEEYPPLKDSLCLLSECISEVQEQRSKILVERIEQMVVDKLSDMDNMSVKPTKLLLNDRESALKAMAKKRQQYQTMTQKNALDSKIGQKFAELENDTKRAHNINASVDSNILKYEEQRVNDMKEILEEWVKCNVFFHCKALEEYSRVLARIQTLDGGEALKELQVALSDCDDSVAVQPSPLGVRNSSVSSRRRESM